MQLAELHLLPGVEVPGRLEHDEQRVAVALELGPLVGVDGVLDGELGQVVQLGQLTHLARLGPVHPQPGQPVSVNPSVSRSQVRLSSGDAGVATRLPAL